VGNTPSLNLGLGISVDVFAALHAFCHESRWAVVDREVRARIGDRFGISVPEAAWRTIDWEILWLAPGAATGSVVGSRMGPRGKARRGERRKLASSLNGKS
jgi:hypothetical protein